MNVFGVDPSLTGTGIASLDDLNPPHVDTLIPPRGLAGEDRIEWIARHVRLCARGAELIAIEGPAYGSAAGARQSGHHERAGLWWHLKILLRPTPVAVIPPNMRAKYATGKGNASKDQVLLAVARRYPDIEIANNNEADALILAAMAARRMGRAIDDLPKVNLEAMGAVAWPELLSDDGDDVKEGAA